MARSQAAMEFLMSYGWALLVGLIVIAALAYFGVFNPHRILPERCALGIGLYCMDYRLTSTSLVLKIKNDMGKDIHFTRIIANETSGTPLVNCVNDSMVNMSAGQQVDVGFACDSGGTAGLAEGNKYKLDVEFSYYEEDPVYGHTSQGQLFVGVE